MKNLTNKVCKQLRVSVQHIKGSAGDARSCELRQLWWKLLREKGCYSYAQIGRMSNNRTHSTVYLGIQKINGLLAIGDKQVTAYWNKIKDLEF